MTTRRRRRRRNRGNRRKSRNTKKATHRRLSLPPLQSHKYRGVDSSHRCGSWCGKISETYCLSTFSTLLVGPKIQDTFSEQLSGQGTETENGKPGARETYLTGRITEEISVQERTPREALSGYLCAERGVRIGGCVAIQRQECPFLSAQLPSLDPQP